MANLGGKKKHWTLREKGELKAEGNGERERERTNEGATISSHGILFLLVFILPAWNGLARAAAALCCLKRFGEDFQSVLISSCLVQTYLYLSIYLSIYLSTSVQYDLAGDSFLSFWLLID